MPTFHKIYCVLLGLLVNFHRCHSNCANKWISINPDDSQTYVAVTAQNASSVRPLGFMPMTVTFGANPKSCISVDGVGGNGRHYEILLESPTGSACVQPSGEEQLCTNDQTNKCAGTGGGNSITFTFDCTSCEGSQVTFWYRIVVETSTTTGDYDEYWCQKRTPEYPSSLKSTDNPAVIPTPIKNPPGGSSLSLSVQWPLTAIFLLCAYYFM